MVLEMEGYTFTVENGEVKVLVRQHLRGFPENGPVWKRVMANAALRQTLGAARRDE